MRNIDSVSKDKVYYLTDVLDVKVFLHGKKIGKLADMIIKDDESLPEVTKVLIMRSFGDPSLIVPFQKIKLLNGKEIIIDIKDAKDYEGEPGPREILLRDHILDKKVLDIEDREVEVVYDIKMIMHNAKLFATDVNISRYRLFRRLTWKWLANIIQVFQNDDEDIDRKIPWKFIQPLSAKMTSFRGDVKLNILKERLDETHPADLADIIEELDSKQRLLIFNELESSHASETLEEINPTVQREMVASMDKAKVASLINKMTPGQAADILSALPMDQARVILKLIKSSDLNKIESILEKQEEKVLNYITNKIFIFHENTKVEYARREYYHKAKNKDELSYIYVVDNSQELVGVIDIKDLFQAHNNMKLQDIMDTDTIVLDSKNTLKEALELFSHYDFRALPVVDKKKKIVGVIPYKDVMKLKHKFWE